MVRKSDSTQLPIVELPRVPPWAIPHGTIESDVDAAYAAGAALTALDQLVQTDADWLGAWRQRLALRAATASIKLSGRREDEAALRDAWHLRQADDALGPSGEILLAWRRLAARSSRPDTQMVESVAGQLGIAWSSEFEILADYVSELATSVLPAPLVAAQAADLVMTRNPKAELLAWWMADCTLSIRMRWPVYVPLLATQIHSPMLRLGEERRRARPGMPEFSRVVCIAIALGATQACRLAGELSAQAEKLRLAEPKLRSKSAHLVIAQLLSDDSVSGSFTTKTLSRWANRRLFERLIQLDAVRELSGRDTFKLYGL